MVMRSWAWVLALVGNAVACSGDAMPAEHDDASGSRGSSTSRGATSTGSSGATGSSESPVSGAATSSADESSDGISYDLPPGQDCAGYSVVRAGLYVDDNEELAELVGVSCVTGALQFGFGVTNLGPLASLEAVGALQFETPDLASVEGLESLRFVHNDISLGVYHPDAGFFGTQVMTLAPLAGLEEIGSLLVADNANLISIAGLGPAITGDFAGNIDIIDQPALVSLAGFEGLTSTGAGLGLGGLPLVPDLTPLANLTATQGTFAMAGLDAVTSMEGLEQLTQVGALQIFENAQLQSLAGLEGLVSVAESVSIRDNPMLPYADVEAWVAQVDVGTTTTICNNLGGPRC
jgi:hypothetical protein